MMLLWVVGLIPDTVDKRKQLERKECGNSFSDLKTKRKNFSISNESCNIDFKVERSSGILSARLLYN